MSAFPPHNQEQCPAPETKPEECPLGYLVYAFREVDPINGCGHRRCYPQACELLRRALHAAYP